MKKTVTLFLTIIVLVFCVALTAGGCGAQMDIEAAAEVAVTVTDKTNIPENIEAGQYSDRVQFTFTVDNMTEKDIKGVQGTLQILDLFNAEILSIDCDFTGETIPANSSITVSDLGVDINEFMDADLKLYNEAYDDLQFIYSVDEVVFSDGQDSQSATAELPMNDQKAVVAVTGKTSMPEDYNADRYSPCVALTFNVSNMTDKDIKGIQGILIVKDMFGSDILSSQCDFTGETILANSSAAFGDLVYEVNEFMDEDVKFYNEKFEDLFFEYQMSTIVYTDGTIETL